MENTLIQNSDSPQQNRLQEDPPKAKNSDRVIQSKVKFDWPNFNSELQIIILILKLG